MAGIQLPDYLGSVVEEEVEDIDSDDTAEEVVEL